LARRAEDHKDSRCLARRMEEFSALPMAEEISRSALEDVAAAKPAADLAGVANTTDWEAIEAQERFCVQRCDEAAAGTIASEAVQPPPAPPLAGLIGDVSFLLCEFLGVGGDASAARFAACSRACKASVLDGLEPLDASLLQLRKRRARESIELALAQNANAAAAAAAASVESPLAEKEDCSADDDEVTRVPSNASGFSVGKTSSIRSVRFAADIADIITFHVEDVRSEADEFEEREAKEAGNEDSENTREGNMADAANNLCAQPQGPSGDADDDLRPVVRFSHRRERSRSFAGWFQES